MDKQQFATLSIGIKSAYPASKILEDNASKDFWYTMLKDIPYEIAENAVMEHICTNIYPPNIAEIRKLCVERCQRPVLSFDEAYSNFCTCSKVLQSSKKSVFTCRNHWQRGAKRNAVLDKRGVSQICRGNDGQATFLLCI